MRHRRGPGCSCRPARSSLPEAQSKPSCSLELGAGACGQPLLRLLVSGEGRGGSPAPPSFAIGFEPQKVAASGSISMQEERWDLLSQPEKALRWQFWREPFLPRLILTLSPGSSPSASCKYCACSGALCEARCPERRERLHVCQVSLILLTAQRPGLPERRRRVTSPGTAMHRVPQR